MTEFTTAFKTNFKVNDQECFSRKKMLSWERKQMLQIILSIPELSFKEGQSDRGSITPEYNILLLLLLLLGHVGQM